MLLGSKPRRAVRQLGEPRRIARVEIGIGKDVLDRRDLGFEMLDLARQAIEVALRMLEAGVDAVGVHLQADARRADPKLIESQYLGDVARALFKRVGGAAPVQVVGGLSVAEAKSLARAGLRAFVISGNLGLPDGRARYDLPPDRIERYVAAFIADVSGA